MHQSPGYGACILCSCAPIIYSNMLFYAPGYSGYIQLCSNNILQYALYAPGYTALLDNMEPIVRREDVIAHDYVATAGNYFIGISTHASQLSHHSPPDSCTVLYSCTHSPSDSGLVTINASRTSHPGPITHQTSQQLHRLTSERRRPHQNNNHMDVGLSAPVNPLFDTNSNSLGAVVVDWRCGLIEMRRILGWRSFV